MRVFISGGFGYLGARLSHHLAVHTSHDISLGTRSEAEPPKWAPDSQVIQIKWDSIETLEKACANVDVIVHMAGSNSIDCALNPVDAFLVNAVGTGNLLQAAIQQGVKRFIYLSTAHVYSSPLAGVISENTCPNNLHPYATSHRAGEDIVRFAHLNGKIEGLVIRLSNAFGAPMNKEANCWMLLINDICRQVVSTNKIVLKSNGLQKRNFIPISDVCNAINHLILLPFEQIDDGLFNLGGREISIFDMAEMVRERTMKILGFLPNIMCHKTNSDDLGEDLSFLVEKLYSTGFSLKGSEETEIDNTLLICNTLWGVEE